MTKRKKRGFMKFVFVASILFSFILISCNNSSKNETSLNKKPIEISDVWMRPGRQHFLRLQIIQKWKILCLTLAQI